MNCSKLSLSIFNPLASWSLANLFGLNKQDITYRLPNSRLRRLLYPKLDFHFKSLDETLKYCSVFFAEAERIYIAAGELFPPFYNNEKLLCNLENSAKGGAEIKVLFGPALYVDSADFLAFAMKYKNVELFKRKERRRAHFKAIKNKKGLKLAIIDTPHGINNPHRESWVLTHDYLDEIIELENEFREQLKTAEYVDKKTLIKKFTDERGKINNKGDLHGFIYKPKGSNQAEAATDEQISKLNEKLNSLLDGLPCPA